VMSRGAALFFTLAAGTLVGIQPAANAALSEHVGDFGAAFVSIVVSATIIGLLLLVVGHPGRLSALAHIRPEQLLGGLGGAAVVTIGLIAVRPLGAGGVVALLVAGQMIISVIADRFGWFGLHHVGIGIGRVLGVVLVIAGTVLVTRT
jgi:transporter family-2 protein